MSLNDIISPVDDNPDAPGGHGFTEFKESGDEEFDYNGGIITATRIFDGPWENRYEFINSFSTVIDNVNGKQIYISPPSHPTIKGAYVTKASVKGMLATDRDSVNNIITHRIARITLTYETLKYVPEKTSNTSDRQDIQRFFIEETLESSGEFYALEAGNFKDGDGKNLALRGTTKIPLRIIDLHYRLAFPFIYQPRFAFAGIMAGKVNFTPFTTPSGLVAPPETLLFNGISGTTKREIFEGLLVWQITYNFAYRATGWNNYPVVGPDENGNNKVHWIALDPPLYESDEFRRLFYDITIDESNNLLALWAKYQFATAQELLDALQNGLITQAEYDGLLLIFGIYLN